MSVAQEHDPDPADSYSLARQRKLKRTLESYGILTADGLREAAHAGIWNAPFERALDRAVRAGRIRRLSRDLYEAGPER